MTSISQRIAQLRTERGISRVELSAALGLPKNAAEKFETGRQTPSQEQQEKLAAFFGVSVPYLCAQTNDRTSMESWMDLSPAEVEDTPRTPAVQKAAAPATGTASIFSSFSESRQFRESLSDAILEALRSPEGQKILSQAIRQELLRK